MSFTAAIVKAYANYFNFKGRARRKEYWYFFLFVGFINMICNNIDIPLLSLAAFVLTFIPMLSLQWRRLHDIGKSGKWWFITLTIVGIFYLLALCSIDSQPNTNRYGECPKYTPNN